MGFGSGGGISRNKSGIDRNSNKEQKDLFEEDKNDIPKSNKFLDKKEWPSTLEEGKQGKHIPGNPNFQGGKSELSMSMDEVKKLVDMFAGTGVVIGKSETSTKEWVDFGKTIGFFVDKNGNKHSTTKGIIHHSKKGTHIVPADPDGTYLGG